MKVLSGSGDIVLPSELLCLRESLLSHFGVEGTDKSVLLFFREQSRHHTDSKNVIDELKESLFDNVSISEEEGLGLLEHLSVEGP